MVQHVALEVSDPEPDAGFWELLGFERVESLVPGAVWLERDGTQIHLLIADDAVAPPQGHAAVVVEDFDAAYARVEGAGHPIEERKRHWGAKRAFARTPGGHRVELMAAPPPTRA